MEMMKKILILVMAVIFSMNGVAFGSDAAVSTLANAPLSNQLEKQGEVGGVATEAIGEGFALAEVLKGNLPKTLDASLVSVKTMEKIHAAIDYALEKLAKYSFPDQPEGARISAGELEYMRTETIARLTFLRHDLTDGRSTLKLFNAVYSGKNDFVYGYNRSAWDNHPSVALAVEYMDFLSVRAAAEVLAHEICPKRSHLIPPSLARDVVTVRQAHRDVYNLFQAPIFWAGGSSNIVKEETNRFTALMSQKAIRAECKAETMKEMINGQNLIRLTRTINPKDMAKVTTPQIIEAIIAPAAGFAMVSLKVLFPGRKEPVEVMAAKPIDELIKTGFADYDVSNPPAQNPYGNNAFKQELGGCWVFPFVNRYTGPTVQGRVEVTYPSETKVYLPANNPENVPLSVQCQLHGVGHWIKRWVNQMFIWAFGVHSEHQGVVLKSDVMMARSTATKYNPEWPLPSNTRVQSSISLGDSNNVFLNLRQTNMGKEPIWVTATRHEYFRNLSPDVWMWLPATHHCPIYTNAQGKPDYSMCRPTGEIVPVSEPAYSAFDYNVPKPIDRFLDDSWTRIKKNPDGSFTAEIYYPAFNCKMRLRVYDRIIRNDGFVEKGGLKSAQVFTHPNGRSVSIEPTNQLNNPLDNTGTTNWRDEGGKPLDTGMAELHNGDTYEYAYEYEWLMLGQDELPKTYSAWKEAVAMGVIIANNDEDAGKKLEAYRHDQKANTAPIAEATEEVTQAVSKVVKPMLTATDKTNVAVVLQKNLLDMAASGNAELAGKYQVMLQDLRKRYGDAVVTVDSSDPSVLAAEINRQMERGYSVVGVTDSAMVEKLSGKVRGAADRFKVMGVDLARPEELKDGVQFVNINYIVLMGLAAMRGNPEAFERAYRIVTGKTPGPGSMGLWFIRVLPKIVKFSTDMNDTARTAALKKLFDAAA